MSAGFGPKVVERESREVVEDLREVAGFAGREVEADGVERAG